MKKDIQIIKDNDLYKKSVLQYCQRLYRWQQLSSEQHSNILCLCQGHIEHEKNHIIELTYITKYIPGPTLDQIMSFLSLNQKIKIVHQMIESIKILHQNQLVHGDLKPQNFICRQEDDNYEIVLIDMDFLSESNEDVIIDSTPIYTGPFFIPSYEADLWALGLSIYQIVTNQKLIKGWFYDNYRKRDCLLHHFENGYGIFDSIIKLLLSKNEHQITIFEASDNFKMKEEKTDI